MTSYKTIAVCAVFVLICARAALLVFGDTSPIDSGKAKHEQPEEQSDCVRLHPNPFHPLNSQCY